MNTVFCTTFTAKATIGLYRGYSNKRISVSEFKRALLHAQESIQAQHQIALSGQVSRCEILFLGQEEPAMELQFIQYPKFPHEESALKKAITTLIQLLMLELEQNRVVIVFTNETLMLEQADAIDPRIRL